jgi:hypothetical protein
MERVELTKVKCTQSGDTSGNPFEHCLWINNKKQYCKISRGVLVRGGRVNGWDEGKGIWLTGFIYIYEIEQ